MFIQKKQQKKPTSGFTLIELLIVIAIVSVLAALSLPVYTSYINRAKFTELISATHPYKLAAEAAVQLEGVAIQELNAGSHRIPNPITEASAYGRYVSSVAMSNGTITAVARDITDSNGLPVTYILNIQVNNGTISWNVDQLSTCLIEKLC